MHASFGPMISSKGQKTRDRPVIISNPHHHHRWMDSLHDPSPSVSAHPILFTCSDGYLDAFFVEMRGGRGSYGYGVADDSSGIGWVREGPVVDGVSCCTIFFGWNSWSHSTVSIGLLTRAEKKIGCFFRYKWICSGRYHSKMRSMVRLIVLKHDDRQVYFPQWKE